MLEILTPEMLRSQLKLETALDGGPTIGSVANAVRTCVEAWRMPARARVTAHLHRQLIAAGFEEDLIRARVGEVLDALIDVGDLTPVRLSGKASLVLSRPQWVRISSDDYAILGRTEADTPALRSADGYVRRGVTPSEHPTPIDLAEFLGPPGFQRHLARRTSGTGNGTLAEFWATLSASIHHDGRLLDTTQLRAVVDPPGTHNGHFGRYNQPTVSGRWKTAPPDGIWCAVRPGRNPNEWHPIVIRATGAEVQSIDLFDWDEWNWALLARGSALGAPERAIWAAGTLSFEHPVPAQFQRALRLLGTRSEWAWTWNMTEGASAALSQWRQELL